MTDAIAKDSGPSNAAYSRFQSQAFFALPPLLALLITGRALFFPFSGLDDAAHFREHLLVTDPGSVGLWEFFQTRQIGYPIPITVLSYILDYQIAGFDPRIFHGTNLLLHALNVSLVTVLAYQLLKNRNLSVLAGALFASHPLVVEPVCWATGRKDLLSTGLCLLTLCLVLSGDRLKKPRKYSLALLTNTMSMLSKPTSAGIPLMGVTLAYFTRKKRPPRAVWTWAALALALNLALIVLGVIVVREQQEVLSQSLPERAQSVLAAWGLSVERLFVPVGLVPYYFQYPNDPSTVVQAMGLGALFLGVAYFARSATPVERSLLLMFAFAYAPASGVAGHLRWTADSYLYLPLSFLSVFAASLFGRFEPRRLFLKRALCALVIVTLSILTVLQSELWKKPENMWFAVTSRYPQSPVAQSELAQTLRWVGKEKDADLALLELDLRFPDFDQKVTPRVELRLRRSQYERAAELLEMGVRAGDQKARIALLTHMINVPALRPYVGRDELRIAASTELESFASAVKNERARVALYRLLLDDGLVSEASRAKSLFENEE